MPAMAQAMMETLFKGWFTNAIASAFIVGVAFAVIGGLCALLLRRHVKETREARDTGPRPVTPALAADPALPETAAAEVDGV